VAERDDTAANRAARQVWTGSGRQAQRRSRALFSATAAAAAGLALVLAGVAPASAAASRPSARTNSATRLVTYHGYQIRVPSSWPVYNLASDPTRCVLFNRHAVYLGTPGANQRCPARAYGRTEAVLVQPASPDTELPPGTVMLSGRTAALPSALPAVAARATAQDHAFQVAAPGPGVLVTGTYGRDRALISSILNAARMTAATRSAGTSSRSGNPRASSSVASTNRAASTQGDLVGQQGSGLGFDACTAPSATTMTDWLASPYRVIGTYLGGDNWACSYGNFNAAWVSQVAAEGWQFIPIWVGPQAPCSTISGATLIDPSDAAAEGQAQAASAVTTAEGFGYGTSTPIYFDMEGYDSSNTSCAQAVLTFLGGWTQGLHAAGYKSGVYSSADSGISDLASEYGSSSYTSPDDVWFADWTGDPVLTDPVLPAGDWSGQRLHQYYGGHNETWGGATVNIDNNVIDGTVAGLPGSVTSLPAVAANPAEVTAAPGSATSVQLVIAGASSAATGKYQHPSFVHWQVSAPAGLTVTPASGFALIPPGRADVATLRVALSSSLAAGRYDLTVTAAAGNQPLTETFVLVTAVSKGATLAAPYPVVFYAADSASMGVAVASAASLALPTSDVTGNFDTAWNDVAGGKDLVLAVGQAAVNALNQNPCGWSNPAGTGAGTTPFFYVGVPLQQPAGADVFEPSDGTSLAETSSVTAQLIQYALAGTLPDEAGPPVGPSPPQDVCLGSSSVPVP
jgi:Domain of unknown function (DUF1906)